MRVRWLPVVGIALSLLLSGCARKTEATYLTFGSDAVAIIREGSVLTVIDMPSRVVESYGAWRDISTEEAVRALVPVDQGMLYAAPVENLKRLKLLLSALSRETDVEDGWEALSASRKQVKKSAFPEVLELLAQAPGLWKELGKASRWTHLDLGQVLPEAIDWNKTEPWLDVWFQGALRAGRRRD